MTSHRSADAVIAAFAQGQYGLVTLVQLLAAGLTESGISRRVARGALHRVHQGVYSLTPVLSQEARWLAPVLAAGEGAALSHVAAADLWRLRRYPTSRITVVAPRRRRIEGVTVHRCNHLDPVDVTTYRNIPVTTVSRMFVDLTDVLNPEQLANVIHEAAFRNRFDPEATRAAIARARGRRKLHVLEAALALNAAGSAGTKSPDEDAFLALIRAAGLPEPLPNTVVHGFQVDCHWPERRLVAEVDGGHHTRPRTALDDKRRDRLLRAAGYTVLRFADIEIEQRPAEVISVLARAL